MANHTTGFNPLHVHVEIEDYSIVYFEYTFPCSKHHITDLSLRVGLTHAS